MGSVPKTHEWVLSKTHQLPKSNEVAKRLYYTSFLSYQLSFCFGFIIESYLGLPHLPASTKGTLSVVPHLLQFHKVDGKPI